ncbi:MAG: 2-succinyl-5-enolpyruvyl-6-hydroxy-3-cyclohexene-1-carboxylic-acid synthase [Gemmatimonadota bacterium]|nr:2-succinyl-5-enolpyruvyl-6-hydroxy-3-cyclohexene-1-carboxylic-acid synthase [Gemmatimonadota bacterium]
MSGSVPQAVHAYVTAFVEELSRSGLRHVCIAPGSRSTPLAMAIASHSRIRTWMHLDERSASFFALGMARALGEPVGILCTSGSAAANFFPAIVEARSSSVPLVVLTADRPPELRDTGAAQTIDQNRLYGSYAKWFVEVALTDGSFELLCYIRTLACRAVATAASIPAGAVHLNFPFREPLLTEAPAEPANMNEPDALAWRGRPDGEPWAVVSTATAAPSAETLRHLIDVLSTSSRPLIVCGPQHDEMLPALLGKLASVLGAPLLADPLSGLRWGPHERGAIVDRYDAMLRDEMFGASVAPDVILRFGGLPTSKPLLQFMQRCASARQIIVDQTKWPDPTLLASEVIHADPVALCVALVGELIPTSHATDADWLKCWKRKDAAAREALAAYVGGLREPFEGAVLSTVASVLPVGAALFVSSSMPVRDLDAFAPGDDRVLEILANRGANGIDGIVSSALGAAAALSDDGPLVLVIGDIAFYHDMNGLLAAKLHQINATIVVINNDGGGIFSFLPQAAQPTHFEQLFGTPHGLSFEPAATLYGARYHRAEDVSTLGALVTSSMSEPGLGIIELRTDRARNVELHREAWRRVATALEAV